ncbi:ribose transport system substrate-binding protein [Evansella vedderi]|uniref:Ribose transport system substrate-binding protein n=1 Tax=Evansella vedderi TaxID=38282 RepID=A0ABT9ZPW7_9BACI|nr:sugar-binding protein [Evansella vedderi]MDQ0253277.1 ribose transport system substrate-binding protein [Evansella vedderi]
MNRNFILYLTLMVSFIGALGFSFYFYMKANYYDYQISEATSTYSSLPNYHFVLISEEVDHEYWRLVEEGAKEAEAVYDVYVEYKGPRNSNPEEQVRLLDMAIAAKVDGIIVQALNDEMFTPLINKAVENGIPVITIDTDVPNSSRMTYIGTDNYQSGQIAGQALIEDTNGEAVVGIIANSFSSIHQQLRIQGFKDAVENIEGIQIVAIEESNNSRVRAAEKADKILGEHEEITAFFGTSALDGLGISTSMKALQRQDDIYILAFDSLKETLDLLEQGKVDAVVAQEPFQMGYQSVERMLAIITGQQVQNVYHTNTSIIRKSDLRDWQTKVGVNP